MLLDSVSPMTVLRAALQVAAILFWTTILFSSIEAWKKIKRRHENHPLWKMITLHANLVTSIFLSTLVALSLNHWEYCSRCSICVFFVTLTSMFSPLPELYRCHNHNTRSTFLLRIITAVTILSEIKMTSDCLRFLWMLAGSCCASFYWWHVMTGIYNFKLGAPKVSKAKLLYYPSGVL